MNKVMGTLIPAVIVALASLFGYMLEPDNAIVLAITGFITSLHPGVQVGLLISVAVLLIVPHIAPYTPWTWDDWTISKKNAAVQVLARLWNALAGNFGKANNKPDDGISG